MPLVRQTRAIPVFLLILIAAAPGSGQDKIDGFVAGIYKGLPYRLFIPPSYRALESYPLVLYLHGSDARGTDNRSEITGFNKPGTHVWTRSRNQKQHPAFVVAPQSPGLWDATMPLVLELLTELETEFNIDRARLYIVGQSMGGIGVWQTIAKNPELFAAAVPLCGIGQVEDAPKITQIPIWAFHGAKDFNVPVSGSRNIIKALRKLDGNVRYTEYPKLDHFIWTTVFAQQDLVDWLFAQHK